MWTFLSLFVHVAYKSMRGNLESGLRKKKNYNFFIEKLRFLKRVGYNIKFSINDHCKFI